MMANKDTQIAELTTQKQNARPRRSDEAKIALDAEVAKGKENEEKVA